MAALNTGRLPTRLVPLVGRQRELQDVLDSLPRSRLLTLTGPGGTGKTRLALAVASAAGPSFSSGACRVELAPIDDPAIVGETVATRLGVPDSLGQGAAERIAEHVGEASLLLVLDNCEHLTAAAADLAERLLGACPALSILATSREVLGVDGERNWPVPPLSLPQEGQTPAVSALAGYDAVRLFEQRAQLVLPSFRLTGDNAAAVLQVCRRVDGLPLAIELAAARMRILSACQLAERLDDVFTVLVGGSRSAPLRHQALRGTLDWSHDLLAEDERAAFRRLAVFAGGFTLAAAEQVVAAGDLGPEQALDLMARLADKSLLRVDHAGDDVRYHLLSTVRDYARDRLAEAGEHDAARQAHLRCYVAVVEEAGTRIDRGAPGQGPGGLERELDRLDTETPNIRAALEYARECGDAIAALRIAGSLGHYAYLRGHYLEVRQWMDAAVADGPHAPTALQAKALLGSGRLAFLQCDYVAAVRRLDAALRIFRDAGDARGVADTLQVLGGVAREHGRYARSMELHAEGLALAEAIGDQWSAARAHGYLGFASWLQCDFARASAECGTALAMFRELGDVEGIAWSLISLAAVARYQGHREQAAALLAESRSSSERIGFNEGVAWSLEQLGLLATEDGDPGAGPLLVRSLAVHRELHDRWRMSSVLEDLAALSLARGSPARAARLLAAAGAIRETIGTVIPPCEAEQHTRTLAAVQTALGADAFAAAWQEGLLASADALLAELQAEWPAGDVTAWPGGGGAGPGRACPDGRAVSPAQEPTVQEPAVQEPAVQEPAGGARAGQVAAVAVPAAHPAGGSPAGQSSPGVGQAGPALAGAATAGATQAATTQDETTQDETTQAATIHDHSTPARNASAGITAPPAPPAPLRIRALGAATVHRADVPLTAADWGYAKPRELLFLLIASPPLTREQIGTALWPDQPRQQLGNALHTALRGLRRALGHPGWVQYADGRYSFNPQWEHDCDLTSFEQALAAARKARPAAAALPDLQHALAAYGGDFLDGLAAGEWAQARRAELRRSFESALLATGRLHVAAGRYGPAAVAFRRAVGHEPLNETAHRELMSCWERLGETARAVQHYQDLVELLKDQVGVPPSAETTALYRRLLDKR